MNAQTADTIEISREEHEALRRENACLKEELSQLKRLIFGKKNERFIPSDSAQTSLAFDGDNDQGIESSNDLQQISYSREKPNKKKPVRLELPAHLPREEEVLEPEEKGEDAVKIGETVTEILEYTPGKVYVKRYVRPKYVYPANQGSQKNEKQVVVAPLPTLPIPSGNAGPGLLAHLMISKYVDHLPFYRQVQIFKREGVKLSESTVNGWFRAVCKLIEPLYHEIRKQVLTSGYIKADETPIPVQTSNKAGATHTGYHWFYYSSSSKLVVIDYQKSRSGQGPRTFLEGYQGALQTDGYKGYEQFDGKPGITLLACMAHARRYFEKALENDRELGEKALIQIQKLYLIERQCKKDQLDEQEIKELRQKEAKPILKELNEWMQKQYGATAPESKIGKALAYSLKLWKRLSKYIENGQWDIDNNLVENSIRPIALGRKNYLFAGSHDAAQWAAMMYSLLGTCKLNDVEPYQWLRDTLIKIPDTSISQLDTLLPNYQQKSENSNP